MVSDLISRAAAIAEIKEYIEEYSELEPETGYHNLKWCAMEEAKDVLTMLPAIDAVPIVRCKDCKHYYEEQGSCDLHDERGPDGEIEHRFYVTPDWFCADGGNKND